MDKKTRIVALILLVIIGVGATYVLLNKDTTTNDQVKTTQKTESQETPPPAESTKKGEYTEYSADLFASTKGTRLLFFHASWCPQCRALDESIRTTTLPDNVTIFKVDYDSHQSLRATYGVTLQTTVVKVDENGNKTASYVAYDDPTFERVEESLLP